jgi:cytochrome c553
MACLGLVASASDAAAAGALMATPDRIERGRYLAHHVTGCIECHSERNWAYYAGPVVPGTEGQGAKLDYLRLDKYAPNVTPAGIADWTDAELIRAIREGVDRKGQPVHSFLPSDGYARLSKDDVESLVIYLRTLKPIASQVPRPKAAAGKAPHPPVQPQPAPAPSDTVAYGKYLVSIANCRFCHGETLTGGKEFQIPGRPPIAALNITPFEGTATSRDQSSFIGRFKAFASDGARRLRAPQDKPSTVMPWTEFARMTEQDQGAIYDYLRTLQPKPAAKVTPAGAP